jgi:hypothetical protein
MKAIPASTALAVWMGTALVGVKLCVELRNGQILENESRFGTIRLPKAASNALIINILRIGMPIVFF